ncbi:hypothetical protein EYF80_039457 [Liparis tanakae]|uniref:Uncharacterized protein n=1 Tax=Liparis tanakae TaxID=230148 RepID=A0A4Z2G9Z1_9TELE|nr:hypothetical protein EYF80_039457 [Liparis tanakae]
MASRYGAMTDEFSPVRRIRPDGTPTPRTRRVMGVQVFFPGSTLKNIDMARDPPPLPRAFEGFTLTQVTTRPTGVARWVGVYNTLKKVHKRKAAGAACSGGGGGGGGGGGAVRSGKVAWLCARGEKSEINYCLESYGVTLPLVEQLRMWGRASFSPEQQREGLIPAGRPPGDAPHAPLSPHRLHAGRQIVCKPGRRIWQRGGSHRLVNGSSPDSLVLL